MAIERSIWIRELNRQQIRQLLAIHGLAPSKRHGQNFLFDASLIQQLNDFAALEQDEAVVEIGPGLGALTEHILTRSARSVFIEIDSGFCRVLRERFADLRESDRLLEADVLEFSGENLAVQLSSERFAVVSNVPYSISSEILLWLFRNRRYLSRACLLLQREFAERIAAGPGSRAYGSLSVLRELYSEVEKGPIISGDRFYPKAQVESLAISLEMRGVPLIKELNDELFERVVRASFAQRRKTLANSLASSNLFEEKPSAVALLESLGIDPSRRAETLSVAEFAEITSALEQPASS